MHKDGILQVPEGPKNLLGIGSILVSGIRSTLSVFKCAYTVYRRYISEASVRRKRCILEHFISASTEHFREGLHIV